MTDLTYQRFVKRWQEVTDLPTQSLGPFTGLYKWVTKRFKVMPWPWFVGMSIVVAVALYVFLGSAVSYLVTLLQRGF